MENILLTIEHDCPNVYRSHYVVDLLAETKMRAMAIIVVNLYEDDHLLQIKFVTREFTKDDFLIELRNGNLFIYAEKLGTARNENLKHYSFNIDTFSKRFVLPINIDKTAIKARFQDGMLIIDLPKRKL